MGTGRLNIVLAFFVLLSWACDRSPKCVPIISDFEQAYDTFPFGKTKFATSSSGMRIAYGTNLGGGYTSYDQVNCPRVIKRVKSASHYFQLLGMGISIRLDAAPNGNHITLIQYVNNGPNEGHQHVISHNVESNKPMSLKNNGYTGLRNDHTFYSDIEAYFASDITLLDETFEDILVVNIKSGLPQENRLIKTYYVHKTIGLIGFDMTDDTQWIMW